MASSAMADLYKISSSGGWNDSDTGYTTEYTKVALRAAVANAGFAIRASDGGIDNLNTSGGPTDNATSAGTGYVDVAWRGANGAGFVVDGSGNLYTISSSGADSDIGFDNYTAVAYRGAVNAGYGVKSGDVYKISASGGWSETLIANSSANTYVDVAYRGSVSAAFGLRADGSVDIFGSDDSVTASGLSGYSALSYGGAVNVAFGIRSSDGGIDKLSHNGTIWVEEDLGLSTGYTAIGYRGASGAAWGVIPEPATMGMFGFCGLGLLFIRRRITK